MISVREPRRILVQDVFGDTLAMYVVYTNPADFPGKFVVRRQDVLNGELIAVFDKPEAVVDTLEEARAAIPPDKVCLSRHPDEDPVIVESWL